MPKMFQRLPKQLALLATFALALIVHPSAQVSVPDASDRSERAERFAVDLKMCKQAYADGKPGKCALYGKIQVVDSFPDVKVQKVDAFPDIKVEWVDAFADKPGKWEKVDAFPDYKVQFVEAFPDYKVQFVDAFPGCD